MPPVTRASVREDEDYNLQSFFFDLEISYLVCSSGIDHVNQNFWQRLHSKIKILTYNNHELTTILGTLVKVMDVHCALYFYFTT